METMLTAERVRKAPGSKPEGTTEMEEKEKSGQHESC